MTTRVERAAPFIIILLVVAGLVNRLYGVGYGLPFLYDPDEPIFVDAALGMLRNLDPNPHTFAHPAATTISMLVVMYVAIFSAGRVSGAFAGVRDFVALYQTDPTILYLPGRLLSVAFGVLTIWLVYVVARRLFDRRAALIAAALIALSPVHVQYSQLVRTDVMMGVFLLAAFWFCLDIIDRGTWKAYILSGVFTGVAVVTKYPAAVFGLTIAFAHWLAGRFSFKEHRKLVAAGVACLIAAFVCAPFLFIDYRSAWAGIMNEARPTHLGATGQGFLPNLVWYARIALPESIGMVGVLLAAVGAVLCVASGKHQQWLLVAFIASFLLMISALTLRWVRWSVPVLPFLCILSAHTIDVCVRWLADKVSVRAALAAGAAVLVLMLAPLIVADARQMSEAAGVDTRTEVRQWILDNIPAGSRLLMELNGPQMPRDSYHFYYVTNAGSLVRLDTAAHMHATYRPAAGWSDELFYLKRSSDIGDAGINYIVMANWYDRYLAEKDRYPDEIARYEEIMRLGVLVHETESSAGRNRGPKIRVFQVPVAGSGN